MDREKVIEGLQDIQKHLDTGYSFAICWKSELIRDALALLKEQETVEPYQHDAVWLCGNCTKEVVGWTDDITGEDIRYPFCRQCGRSVKWNE